MNWLNDSAQDLIEYALLGAVFALLTFATWESVTGTIQRAVLRSNQQMEQLACTPNPLGGVRASVTARDPAAVVSVVGGEEMTAPNVSLEEEVVNQEIATYTFTANLKSLKAYDEMIGTMLDMTA